jgi:hypothetical protein
MVRDSAWNLDGPLEIVVGGSYQLSECKKNVLSEKHHGCDLNEKPASFVVLRDATDHTRKQTYRA